MFLSAFRFPREINYYSRHFSSHPFVSVNFVHELKDITSQESSFSLLSSHSPPSPTAPCTLRGVNVGRCGRVNDIIKHFEMSGNIKPITLNSKFEPFEFKFLKSFLQFGCVQQKNSVLVWENLARHFRVRHQHHWRIPIQTDADIHQIFPSS